MLDDAGEPPITPQDLSVRAKIATYQLSKLQQMLTEISSQPGAAARYTALQGWLKRLLKEAEKIKNELTEMAEGKTPAATVPDEPGHVAASAPSSAPRLAELSAGMECVKLTVPIAATAGRIRSSLLYINAKNRTHYIDRLEPLDPSQPDGPKTSVFILPRVTAEVASLGALADIKNADTYTVTHADLASMGLETVGKSGASPTR